MTRFEVRQWARQAYDMGIRLVHTSYLSFFLHEQNFWRIKFTPKKRINYGKIHSKLPIFRAKSVKFTPAKKNLHENSRGSRDKYEVCS